MIFGNINHLEESAFYPELLQKALAYLRDTDFSELETGKYTLDGDNLFVMVQEMDTDIAENRKAESHELYVDVQYLLQGRERIGYAVLSDAIGVSEDLRPDKDAIFYHAPEAETMLTLLPGDFAVFFPSDIHRPGCESGGPAPIRKVVVKIKYNQL